MARKPPDKGLLDDSHIFLHPVRHRLMEPLAEKLMNINALSIALGMERKLVAYHLFALEDCGLVTSRYAISVEPRAKGKAIRLYRVTDMAADVKAMLKKAL